MLNTSVEWKPGRIEQFAWWLSERLKRVKKTEDTAHDLGDWSVIWASEWPGDRGPVVAKATLETNLFGQQRRIGIRPT